MKLYNDPSRGIVYNPNWPVYPEKQGPMSHQEFFTEYYEDDLPAYNSALQTAIGEAILLEDQKAAHALSSTFEFEPGTFYEVPDLELELFTSGGIRHAPDVDQLYRIVSEPKQEPKVETQEELWEYVITESVSWNGHKNDLQLLIDQFQKEGYSLARKQS